LLEAPVNGPVVIEERRAEEIAAAGETFQAWQNRRAATTGVS
jgi:hypothetical protein